MRTANPYSGGRSNVSSMDFYRRVPKDLTEVRLYTYLLQYIHTIPYHTILTPLPLLYDSIRQIYILYTHYYNNNNGTAW